MANRIYSERIIAFVDVLGFGALIDASQDERIAAEVVENMANAIISSQKSLSESEPHFAFTFTHFSDSFVISLEVGADLREYSAFALSMTTIVEEFLAVGMFLRGGITRGKLIHEKNMLFGPAMNCAYRLESSRARVPRIVLDPELKKFGGKFWPVQFAVDDDGLSYLDYFNPLKAFYLLPSSYLAIRQAIDEMPHSAILEEKRNWLTSKYNMIVAKFSYEEFKRKLGEAAREKTDVARNYEHYLSEARSVSEI